MLKYIQKVYIEQYNVGIYDLEKIEFPVWTEEITDMRIVNERLGKSHSYKENKFADTIQGIKADNGDIIYVTFVSQIQKNIEVVLKISEIYKYSCGIAYLSKWSNINITDYQLKETRIDVMDRTYYQNAENPTKYFIYIKEDILKVDADKVVISDVRYLE